METSERFANLPLLEQAANSIKETGTFKKGLVAPEIADIMRGVIRSLLTGQDKVKASVATMSVRIENNQGIVSGSVHVEKPIKATIGVKITLGNDAQQNKLKLVSLAIEEKAGFAQKLLLKPVNIRGRAERALRDPNKALETALANQLQPKGVKLTKVELQFKDNALSVGLRGEPIPRK